MRAAMAGVLRGIGAADISARSARIAERLAATDAWKSADAVLCFLSMPHEIDTAPLIGAARAQGKTVAVPRIEGNDIRFHVLPAGANDLPRDRWGIPVPDPSWPALDLARAARLLVAAPGLAFDRTGNRLGRGKGYYDRFLLMARGTARNVTAIGICLSEQLVGAVQYGPADQRLDGVVTEAETILVAS